MNAGPRASRVSLMGVAALCALAGAVALGTSPASEAAPSASGVGALRLISSAARSPALTDGRRWAAFDQTVFASRVIDDQAHSQRTRSWPSDCEGVLAGVGGGSLLRNCGSMPLDARTLSLASGNTYTPLGLAAAPRFNRNEVDGIGAAWIRYTSAQFRGESLMYINRRTGQTRTANIQAEQAPDLELPSLMRRLCSPLKRQEASEAVQMGSGQYLFPFGYDSRYGVTVSNPNGVTPLLLEHCGGSAKTISVATGVVPVDFQIRGGIVTWTEFQQFNPRVGDIAVYVYMISARRRFRVTAPGNGTVRVSHTRAALYVSVTAPPRDNSPTTWRIYRAVLKRPT